MSEPQRNHSEVVDKQALVDEIHQRLRRLVESNELLESEKSSVLRRLLAIVGAENEP